MRFEIPRLRNEIIGHDYVFETPFGKRVMTYADYTASGRCVRFIENYLLKIQESYANTHTEDDVTGRSTTRMLHDAETLIKKAVNAGPDVCVIAAGTGSTGAIQRFQQIIGAYLAPAARERLEAAMAASCEPARLEKELRRRMPVVFVGPYEHHSNEITWRECLAEVVPVRLGVDGNIDLGDLRSRLEDPAFDGRLKIGSFSACSNVTGVKAPVHEIARLLHRHGALACFDFAASGPYVELDMNHDDEAYFDAVFLSPHKFLGGPGSSGVLLFRSEIYRRDLPPTCAAGGTVDYVSPADHDFVGDIEEREKPGTPGTLQIMKAALAMALKNAVGVEEIEKREHAYMQRALGRFAEIPGVELLGSPAPGTHIGILSFTIRHGGRYLHPKLVTRLLNDLFGIQSRAGCSCAGPYGHALLGIDAERSKAYREQIVCGVNGVKPGWVRVGFHYTLEESDVDFICDAVEFIATHGHRFLSCYRLDLSSGAWEHLESEPGAAPRFGLEAALGADRDALCGATGIDRATEYRRYLDEARAKADALDDPGAPRPLPQEAEKLAYFYVQHYI